jgi:biotin carboxylase
MKKLLLLGAVPTAIPLIKKARERGIYVISCDYLPENKGHSFANESYYYSTTDVPAILALSKRLQIDGILSFNSDVSAYTSAVVSKALNLPGNDPEVINTLTQKSLFRQFLRDNHFNAPEFFSIDSKHELVERLSDISFPVIVKPVDLSGSKGVVKVSNREDLFSAAENALRISRSHKAIVEEFIEAKGGQLHGDGFVKEGELVFACLGDHHYGALMNNYVPYSTTIPSRHSSEEIQRVMQEVSRFVSVSGLRNCGINIEVRISAKDDKVYIMEIGPRNGGNFIPRVIEYATGFDFDSAALEAALGLPIDSKAKHSIDAYYSYLVVHSNITCKFANISYSEKLMKAILEEHICVDSGDDVLPFDGGNKSLGTLILKTTTEDEMEDLVENCRNYYRINSL